MILFYLDKKDRSSFSDQSDEYSSVVYVDSDLYILIMCEITTNPETSRKKSWQLNLLMTLAEIARGKYNNPNAMTIERSTNKLDLTESARKFAIDDSISNALL